MRDKFDEQLKKLNSMMSEMGRDCDLAITYAREALIEGNLEKARAVLSVEDDINHMERDIESLCMKLILRQQPIARDLRQISAALKMITDMERIGDQAADIADIIPHLQGRSADECSYITEMSAATQKMVIDAVDAFVEGDVNKAEAVIAYDDIVDNYFVDVKKSLSKTISEGTEDGVIAIDFLMIAKYFERIGDHATNIAEWVVYAVTGKHKGFAE